MQKLGQTTAKTIVKQAERSFGAVVAGQQNRKHTFI